MRRRRRGRGANPHAAAVGRTVADGAKKDGRLHALAVALGWSSFGGDTSGSWLKTAKRYGMAPAAPFPVRDATSCSDGGVKAKAGHVDKCPAVDQPDVDFVDMAVSAGL